MGNHNKFRHPTKMHNKAEVEEAVRRMGDNVILDIHEQLEAMQWAQERVKQRAQDANERRLRRMHENEKSV